MAQKREREREREFVVFLFVHEINNESETYVKDNPLKHEM